MFLNIILLYISGVFFAKSVDTYFYLNNINYRESWNIISEEVLKNEDSQLRLEDVIQTARNLGCMLSWVFALWIILSIFNND